MTHIFQSAHWFRQVSPYINQHQGKVMVIFLADEALFEPYFQPIIHDLALLKSLGIKLVIVHGARLQIDQELAKKAIKSEYSQGLRVSDPQAMEDIKQIFGRIRLQFEAAFTQGGANFPNSGAYTEVISGNFVIAKPIGVKKGVDFCFTGQIRQIKEESILKQLNLGHIVLLSPVGYSSTGEVYNISSADLMVEVASRLKADKLIIYGDYADYLASQSNESRDFSSAEVEKQLEGGSLPEKLHQSMMLANLACKRGVSRVHLINYAEDGSLLAELFSREGSGLLVSNEPYEQIMSADINDVGGILELIKPLEDEGILVRRSRELLEQEIEQFIVIKRDHVVIGCAALYPYDDGGKAEVACLTVHQDYRRHNRATKLLNKIEKLAKSQGVSRLFALTTEAIHWFNEQGFRLSSINDLPVKKQKTYNFQRNSKVLIKEL